MPTSPLPENPDLDQLRSRARELQRAVRAGDEAAAALVAEFLPDAPVAASFPLSAAQTVLARRYRFASWARLRRHVEIINERTWTMPDVGAEQSQADEFLRLAGLNYTDDDPARRAAAARLLAENPRLPSTDLAVAAACADVPAVRDLLASGRSAAARTGPYGWSPLMYLAYARHDPDVDRDAVLSTASLLLDAGADPFDGRFFLGLPTPFTVLTGVFAGDSTEQPAHPHAGADANDGQALYNRMFGSNDDFLEVLFEFGLGTGDGGPWRRLLGDQVETPGEMLAALLAWALLHDQRDRVALLAAHGVDVLSPLHVPRIAVTRPATPIEIALVNGNLELADQLRAYGATEPRLGPVRAFVAAALAGDREAVAQTPPEVVARARYRRRGLVVWAASRGRTAAVGLLIEAGFDIDALARADVSSEQKWQTALHTAVEHDDLAMALLLLDLGADPAVHDARFDSTALGWARHLDRPALVALLEPVTPER